MVRRRADFAGSWYPSKESECRKMIGEFSRSNPPCPSTQRPRFGGILPHAGWVYSGQIACNVVECLKDGIEPDTVIIFGRHLHPRSKSYIMKEGLWTTPLGDLEIDQELGERLATAFSFVVETADDHEPDNTIELQLPFVKYFFPDAKILPLGVPPSPDSLRLGELSIEMSEKLGRKALVLGSTDLTHYGYNYGYSPKGGGKEALDWVKNENDRKVVDLIVAMDAEGVIEESLRNHNACCSGAVAAAIVAAKRLGAVKGEKLVYRTSYDIRPNSSFVGYVGVVFS